MKNVEVTYHEGMRPALAGVSLSFAPAETVAVVGRTGAGKSTLGLTLLRILEIKAGTIRIDGVNIQKVKLQHLRKKVTTIPQDPTLFTGTLRFNIDPEEKHSDAEIDDLLKRSGLEEILKFDKEVGLKDFKVEEGGNNLSAGEKQLVCICRAALRKAKIVIFDEATANIDVVSEQKIMELIKQEFKDATVLTIAHRLNTIINSDRIAVMHYGRLKEYGKPDDLLATDGSIFQGLVNELQAKEEAESK